MWPFAGVEKLASALSIGEAIHQEDDGHAHDHRRKKRETDVYVINEVGSLAYINPCFILSPVVCLIFFARQCLGVEELMDTVTSDGFISVDSFPDLAAVFVQQAVQVSVHIFWCFQSPWIGLGLSFHLNLIGLSFGHQPRTNRECLDIWQVDACTR